MAEIGIELSLQNFIIGTLILGTGYIGIYIKTIIMKKDFSNMNVIDKLIQSMVLGTVAIIFTVNFGFLEIASKLGNNEFTFLLIKNPFIFLYQLMFSMVFGIYLGSFGIILNDIINKRNKRRN